MPGNRRSWMPDCWLDRQADRGTDESRPLSSEDFYLPLSSLDRDLYAEPQCPVLGRGENVSASKTCHQVPPS